MRYLRYILVFALMVLGLAKVGAQNDRNFIRQGNRAYHKQKWAAAETQYRKAISKNQKNAQAVYNLGCALMMQQKDSMAMILFENASKLETNKMRRARSYHNMGVVMQQHQQYAQAMRTPCAAIRRTMQPDIILPSARNCLKTRSRTSRTIKTKRIKTRTRTKTSRIRIRTKIRIKARTRTTKIRTTRIRTISRIRTIRTR